RSYRSLMRLDVGYDTRNALTAQLALPADRYPTGEKITAFYRDLLERLRGVSGIDGAAVATGRPLMDRVVDVSTQDFVVPGGQDGTTALNADVRVVSPGFFAVAGVHLIRGRLLEDGDTAQTDRVAVVNQTMAKLYWPSKDAVGQRINLWTLYANGAGVASVAAPRGTRERGREASAERSVRIVGVVSDARQVKVIEIPVRQEMFFPIAQHPEMSRAVTLIVRSRLPTDQAAAATRRTVAAVDTDRPIFEVTTLEQAVADSFAEARLATVLLGFFAVVAIALAGIGLYAVVAFSVSRLTRDIGIRIALGAAPRDVLRLTMSDGWRMSAAGLAIGIVAALALTRLMRTLVFDVSTTDPLTFIAAAALLAFLALLASYLPAHRATRIDPTIALRGE
ncbi:MAG TPA: FtsX-like permease family protein, partial [Vicinamibacterales bacterium]|nr:FtsX-like permease family protein [Vicinamibacterales bacterium]